MTFITIDDDSHHNDNNNNNSNNNKRKRLESPQHNNNNNNNNDEDEDHNNNNNNNNNDDDGSTEDHPSKRIKYDHYYDTILTHNNNNNEATTTPTTTTVAVVVEQEQEQQEQQKTLTFDMLPVDLIQYIFTFDNHLILYGSELCSEKFKLSEYFGRFKSDNQIHLWNLVFCLAEDLDLNNPNFRLIIGHAFVLCLEHWNEGMLTFVKNIEKWAPNLIQLEISFVLSDYRLAQVLFESKANCIRNGLKELQMSMDIFRERTLPTTTTTPVVVQEEEEEEEEAAAIEVNGGGDGDDGRSVDNQQQDGESSELVNGAVVETNDGREHGDGEEEKTSTEQGTSEQQGGQMMVPHGESISPPALPMDRYSGRQLLVFNHLRELTLEFMGVKEEYHTNVINVIYSLKDLIFLELGDLNFTKVILRQFLSKIHVNKVRLTDVSVDGTNIIPLDGIEHNQHISCLELRHQAFYRISEVELARLHKVPRIKNLALSIHTNAADDILAALPKNPWILNLQLFFGGNLLIDKELLQLASMKQLKRLYLRYNDITMPGMMALIRELHLRALILWGQENISIGGEHLAELVNLCARKHLELFYVEYCPECDIVPTPMVYL